MPLLNVSRSPRVCSWRGRNRSCASVEPSTGNPLNAVFAASTSTRPVMTITYHTAGAKPLNTAPASWATRVFCSYPSGAPTSWVSGSSATTTPVTSARNNNPRNMVTASAPIHSSVVAALRPRGLRKAGTPFAMACTPVSATLPEENARRITKTSPSPATAPVSAASSRSALSARSSSPNTTVRTAPQTIIPRIPATNAYTGIASSVPLSRTPRRFIAASSTMARTANSTLCSATNGTADPMFAVADEMDTATVRM